MVCVDAFEPGERGEDGVIGAVDFVELVGCSGLVHIVPRGRGHSS